MSKWFPEQRARHDRALDVPAGAALPPRGFPERLALLRRLPQHEVEGILLAGQHVHALAGAQVVQRLARELPVIRKLAHREIDVAARRAIGEAAVLERLDHLQHARDMLGCARLEIGLFDPERRVVLVHRRDEARGQRLDRLMVLLRALDDLVVDVGDVAHVGHLESERAQPAAHDVEHQHDPRMAEVAVVVDRHAADIHADAAGNQRDELLLFASQGVVDSQHGVARRAPGLPSGRPPPHRRSPAATAHGWRRKREIAQFYLPGVLGKISRILLLTH